MDYTKIPRALIYKDREDIDDFPVSMQFGLPSMEGNYLEALEQRPFIKESYEAPELILKLFNNARYITTLICLENHPNHYFRKYLRIAGSEDRSITIANHAMPATMALVKNYLCHYMPNLYRDSKIVEDITNNFNTEAWKEMTLGGQDDFYKLVIEDSFNHPGWIVDKHFEPRDIKEAVVDPFVNVRDISKNIDYILESLKKSVEISDEEIAPLNAMYKKLESWFPSDFEDNFNRELALGKIGDRLKKLDPNNAFEFVNIMNDMEKSLYNGVPVSSKTKDEIDKYMKKTLGVGLDEIEAASVANQDDDEIENLKTKIKDFEEKNEALKTENKQLKQDNYLLKEENEKLKAQTLENGEQVWIDWLDWDVFHPSIKAEEVYKTIDKMATPELRDKAKCYAFFRVLKEIKWLKKSVAQKDILKWWSAHFGCEWHSDNQLKFTDLPDAITQATTTDQWKDTGGNNNEYYYNYAQDLKKAFVWNKGRGQFETKSQFVKTGCQPPEKCK